MDYDSDSSVKIISDKQQEEPIVIDVDSDDDDDDEISLQIPPLTFVEPKTNDDSSLNSEDIEKLIEDLSPKSTSIQPLRRKLNENNNFVRKTLRNFLPNDNDKKPKDAQKMLKQISKLKQDLDDGFEDVEVLFKYMNFFFGLEYSFTERIIYKIKKLNFFDSLVMDEFQQSLQAQRNFNKFKSNIFACQENLYEISKLLLEVKSIIMNVHSGKNVEFIATFLGSNAQLLVDNWKQAVDSKFPDASLDFKENCLALMGMVQDMIFSLKDVIERIKKHSKKLNSYKK